MNKDKVNIVAGNWKMNKTTEGTIKLLTQIIPFVKNATCEVVVCVPFTNILTARKIIRGTNVQLGAQNVAWAPSGAYTGEISGEMLKELKVKYVIVGHSERRQYFGETNETVNKRTLAAIKANLKVIVCIGETLAERENGSTKDVLFKQLVECFKGFKTREFNKLVIAYEPVWAIGTGKTASKEDANETIEYIRSGIAKKFGKINAERVRIQYGGSMNAKNADELMSMPQIDGGLIGGASLKAEEFAAIVKAASGEARK